MNDNINRFESTNYKEVVKDLKFEIRTFSNKHEKYMKAIRDVFDEYFSSLKTQKVVLDNHNFILADFLFKRIKTYFKENKIDIDIPSLSDSTLDSYAKTIAEDIAEKYFKYVYGEDTIENLTNFLSDEIKDFINSIEKNIDLKSIVDSVPLSVSESNSSSHDTSNTKSSTTSSSVKTVKETKEEIINFVDRQLSSHEKRIEKSIEKNTKNLLKTLDFQSLYTKTNAFNFDVKFLKKLEETLTKVKLIPTKPEENTNKFLDYLSSAKKVAKTFTNIKTGISDWFNRLSNTELVKQVKKSVDTNYRIGKFYVKYISLSLYNHSTELNSFVKFLKETHSALKEKINNFVKTILRPFRITRLFVQRFIRRVNSRLSSVLSKVYSRIHNYIKNSLVGRILSSVNRRIRQISKKLKPVGSFMKGIRKNINSAFMGIYNFTKKISSFMLKQLKNISRLIKTLVKGDIVRNLFTSILAVPQVAYSIGYFIGFVAGKVNILYKTIVDKIEHITDSIKESVGEGLKKIKNISKIFKLEKLKKFISRIESDIEDFMYNTIPAIKNNAVGMAVGALGGVAGAAIGAKIGAMVGSAVAPGIATIVGMALGAIIGLIGEWGFRNTYHFFRRLSMKYDENVIFSSKDRNAELLASAGTSDRLTATLRNLRLLNKRNKDGSYIKYSNLTDDQIAGMLSAFNMTGIDIASNRAMLESSIGHIKAIFGDKLYRFDARSFFEKINREKIDTIRSFIEAKDFLFKDKSLFETTLSYNGKIINLFDTSAMRLKDGEYRLLLNPYFLKLVRADLLANLTVSLLNNELTPEQFIAEYGKLNNAKSIVDMTMDDMITVNGKSIPVKDLLYLKINGQLDESASYIFKHSNAFFDYRIFDHFINNKLDDINRTITTFGLGSTSMQDNMLIEWEGLNQPGNVTDKQSASLRVSPVESGSELLENNLKSSEKEVVEKLNPKNKNTSDVDSSLKTSNDDLTKQCETGNKFIVMLSNANNQLKNIIEMAKQKKETELTSTNYLFVNATKPEPPSFTKPVVFDSFVQSFMKK